MHYSTYVYTVCIQNTTGSMLAILELSVLHLYLSQRADREDEIQRSELKEAVMETGHYRETFASWAL